MKKKYKGNIVVRIMGGLGNQLFQYAFAMELLKKGFCVKIDTSYYANIPKGDTGRNLYISDEYGFGIKRIAPICGRLMNTKRFSYFLNKRGILIYDNQRNIFEENKFNRKYLYLVGYWQNPAYFSDISSEVRILVRSFLESVCLSPLEEKQCLFNERLERIQASPNSVSIHIRGGDYYNSQNVDTFGNICDAEYYRKAVAFFLENNPKSEFFVFSDDLPKAKELLPDLSMFTFFDSDEKNCTLDMLLMSKCKNHIIANSSFSWWGAWLNDYDEKFVIAPKEWNRRRPNNSICDPGWIRF